jgi:hypothetical protein
MKELDHLSRQLKIKDEKNQQLKNAIKELGLKMQNYEVQKSDTTEETNH